MSAVPIPLKNLLLATRLKQFERGQLILYEGDQLTNVFILVKGIIKIFHIDDKGQEKILHILKAPALLPLDCLFSTPRPIEWYHSALTDTEVGVIPLDTLKTHLKENPLLDAYLVSSLALESHELLVRVNSMSKSDAKERVLAVLRFLETYHCLPEKRGWKQTEFPVTHQLLADMAGLTRESATIQLRNLQNQEIARPKRPYLELNVEKLKSTTY